MSKDAIELAVGQFGWWQAKCCLLMALLRMPTAWFQLAIIFIAPETKYYCRDSYNGSISIPTANETCWRRNAGVCEELIFDRSTFSETIITQWGLVCDKSHFVTLTQTTFMFGVLIGNVIFGVLADKYGRKVPLMTALLIQATAGIASSYITSFWLFLMLRFLLALSTGGSMITSFVFCMEILSGRWRTIVSILYQIPFGLGQALMALISYYYRDWRDFNFVLSLISSFFLFYWWFIPESPRWLLAVGRYQEAATLLQQAAITNNRSAEQIKAFYSFNNHNKFLDESKISQKKVTAFDLFTSRALRSTSVCIFFSWFIAGLCFFGLNQHQGKLGGDLFLNVAISGLLGGIPGPLASVYVTQKFGRRYTIFISLTIAGIACLLIAAVPLGVYTQDWPGRVLSTISLIGMSVSYPALYLFSGELFPTVVRNVGVGMAAMSARIGSMLASFLLLSSSWGSWVPVVLLGVFTLISAFFILPLSETKDKPLPDTIEELENNIRVPGFLQSSQDGRQYTTVPCSENS